MKIRISTGGAICGLWSDAVDWQALGRVSVHRASQVEFCARRQAWYVRDGMARNRLHTPLEIALRRPGGGVLHWSKSREEALAWEHAYFSPGGPGWPVAHSRPPRRTTAGDIVMSLLHAFFDWLSGRSNRFETVRRHRRLQAFGKGWSQRRPCRIKPYSRRKPRRF